MEKQTLTIEQMQELKELGIDTSKASMCWLETFYTDGTKKFESEVCNEHQRFDKWCLPAFILQDILEILPSYRITYDKYTNDSDKYEIRVDIPEGQHYITHIAQSSKSLLEAAFKMLKWCKQNNYI